jgi:hypothetical protein
MAPTGYFFVSYARLDKVFVDRLTADLAEAGVNIWRDVDNIEPGTNWRLEIDRAIQETLGIIYVSSRNSIRSVWMEKELAEVLTRSSELAFPIVLDDEGAQHLPELLMGVQWADFRQDYNNGLRQLLKGIARVTEIGGKKAQGKRKSKGYVFLSYCEADADFVKDLRHFLKNRGYAYWDYSESDRDYHGQLFLELEHVIREAVATLSILSPAWKQSHWSVKEYIFSTEVGIPVFLLRVEDMGPTLVIAGIPYIDFAQDRSIGFKRLESELSRKNL